MADAVSPKEIERIAETIGPIIHKLAADAYKAGFEAGERKERERCASGLPSRLNENAVNPNSPTFAYRQGWNGARKVMAAVIRGGESTDD